MSNYTEIRIANTVATVAAGVGVVVAAAVACVFLLKGLSPFSQVLHGISKQKQKKHIAAAINKLSSKHDAKYGIFIAQQTKNPSDLLKKIRAVQKHIDFRAATTEKIAFGGVYMHVRRSSNINGHTRAPQNSGLIFISTHAKSKNFARFQTLEKDKKKITAQKCNECRGEHIPHFNIVERIDDDCCDDDDDDGAAAASAEMMFWMTMPLPVPLIRPGLSYYCANRVHRRCQYPFLTAADNDQLDFLVHQLINEPIFFAIHVEAVTMDFFWLLFVHVHASMEIRYLYCFVLYDFFFVELS